MRDGCASNSVVQYALWMQDRTPEQHERLIRWWQDEVEGTGRVPVMSCRRQRRRCCASAVGRTRICGWQWQQFLLR